MTRKTRTRKNRKEKEANQRIRGKGKRFVRFLRPSPSRPVWHGLPYTRSLSSNDIVLGFIETHNPPDHDDVPSSEDCELAH